MFQAKLIATHTHHIQTTKLKTIKHKPWKIKYHNITPQAAQSATDQSVNGNYTACAGCCDSARKTALVIVV